jgi:hypothetical protein
LLPALLLAALCLGAFAAISPFNGANADEWSYLYMGQQDQWHGVKVNRPFASAGTVLPAWLLPDRPQNIHLSHVFYTYLVALGLYALVYRLGGQGRGVSLAAAALYLIYIPSNPDFSRALFIQPYSWSLLLLMLAALSLTEYAARPGRGGGIFLLASLPLAYIAIRAYEGFIPILLPLPPLILWRRPRPGLWRGLLCWYGAAGLASGLFLWRYTQNEAATRYQSSFSDGAGPAELLARTREFLALSFPLGAFPQTPAHYLLPGLLLAGLLVWGLWRAAEDEPQPGPLAWAGLLLLGLAYTLLGGAAFIYAGLQTEARAQFIPALGQAWVILGLLGLLGEGLARLLGGRAQFYTWGGVGLVFVMGMQWTLAAQDWAAANRGPAFDQKTPFFREALALMPALEDDTLIIYHCPAPQWPPELARPADLFAMAYLYNADRVQYAAAPYHIAPLWPPVLDFRPEGIRYEHEYDLRQAGPVSFTYAYEQALVITCGPAGLMIAEAWPGEWPGGGGYNPYGRIGRGFVAGGDARAVAR